MNIVRLVKQIGSARAGVYTVPRLVNVCSGSCREAHAQPIDRSHARVDGDTVPDYSTSRFIGAVDGEVQYCN